MRVEETQCMEVGMDDFVPKPLKKELLLEALCRCTLLPCVQP